MFKNMILFQAFVPSSTEIHFSTKADRPETLVLTQ